MADWLGHLRGLAAGANVDARSAPVLPERLAELLGDTEREDWMRAAAAVVLVRVVTRRRGRGSAWRRMPRSSPVSGSRCR
jgi:hypothetical protein